MPRWLSLVHGTKRLGLAVGDSQSAVASPMEQISSDDPRLFDRLTQLAREYQAAGIVVGWPLNADGTEGPQGVLARQFAAELARRTGLDVRLWDERLSSFEADQRLASSVRGRLTHRQKKRRHDAVAAAAILEDFFDRNGPQCASSPERAKPPGPE
jgi:putative Holliday junction resolvase